MKLFTIGVAVSGFFVLSACSSTSELVIAQAKDAEVSLNHDLAINQSTSLSTSSIAKRVNLNNAQLRAARLRIIEAQGQVVQSGRLSNPKLGIDLNKNIRSSEGGLEISFAQRFPVTNRLRLEKHISRQQINIAKEEVKVAQRSLTTQAQILAIDILHHRQRAAQLQQQSKVLNEFSNFIEESARQGELSSLDANQAKLEAITLTAELNRIKTEEAIMLHQLKGYIGLNSNRPLNLNGPLPKVMIPKSNLELRNRPEYRAKTLEIEQSTLSIALAKANRHEDIEGKIFTSINRENDSPEGVDTEETVGIGISIPLQFYNKNTGNIQSARASATRMKKEKFALTMQIQQEVATQRAKMKSWYEQVKNLKSNLLPLANKNANELEKAYRNGQAPFTSVLKARSQQLALESQNLDNLEAFHKARVRYFAAIGRENSAL